MPDATRVFSVFWLDDRFRPGSMGLRLLVLSMDDLKLKFLLQDAEDHMRRLSCRQRYEQATSRLPDSRRNIRLGEEKWYDQVA